MEAFICRMGKVFFKYFFEIIFTIPGRYEITPCFVYDEITYFGEENRASFLTI